MGLSEERQDNALNISYITNVVNVSVVSREVTVKCSVISCENMNSVPDTMMMADVSTRINSCWVMTGLDVPRGGRRITS